MRNHLLTSAIIAAMTSHANEEFTSFSLAVLEDTLDNTKIIVHCKWNCYFGKTYKLRIFIYFSLFLVCSLFFLSVFLFKLQWLPKFVLKWYEVILKLVKSYWNWSTHAVLNEGARKQTQILRCALMLIVCFFLFLLHIYFFKPNFDIYKNELPSFNLKTLQFNN
jgi:Zn-dependent protease with chaperone function